MHDLKFLVVFSLWLGMDYVAKNANKPAVASMSLGGGSHSGIDDAVARMTAAGVTTVVAAGNSNRDACNYSPAGAPSVSTVLSWRVELQLARNLRRKRTGYKGHYAGQLEQEPSIAKDFHK